MGSSIRVALNGISVGIIVGAVVSALPMPTNILAAAIMVTVWLIVRKRRRAQFTTRAIAIAAAVVIVSVRIAIVLPVKQLDGVVPPLHYEHVSLVAVCNSLARDHQVFVSPDDSVRARAVVTFTTDRPMTRREVLQKLAHATGTRLDIGYCGTGATLLWGAHPSFTRLRSADGPPNA
jgi:hypothetical protein